MLGVCLGHQALGVVFGATVGRAPELLHGKTSRRAPRRHRRARGAAVAVHRDALPLADHRPRDRAGRARGHRAHRVGHRSWPCGTRPCRCTGVQFHPESVLTEGGHRLLANWLVALRRRRRRRALERPEPAGPRRRGRARMACRRLAAGPVGRSSRGGDVGVGGRRRRVKVGGRSPWASSVVGRCGSGRGRRGRRWPWRPSASPSGRSSTRACLGTCSA